jgi:hypothetical protein
MISMISRQEREEYQEAILKLDEFTAQHGGGRLVVWRHARTMAEVRVWGTENAVPVLCEDSSKVVDLDDLSRMLNSLLEAEEDRGTLLKLDDIKDRALSVLTQDELDLLMNSTIESWQA